MNLKQKAQAASDAIEIFETATDALRNSAIEHLESPASTEASAWKNSIRLQTLEEVRAAMRAHIDSLTIHNSQS